MGNARKAELPTDEMDVGTTNVIRDAELHVLKPERRVILARMCIRCDLFRRTPTEPSGSQVERSQVAEDGD